MNLVCYDGGEERPRKKSQRSQVDKSCSLTKEGHRLDQERTKPLQKETTYVEGESRASRGGVATGNNFVYSQQFNWLRAGEGKKKKGVGKSRSEGDKNREGLGPLWERRLRRLHENKRPRGGNKGGFHKWSQVTAAFYRSRNFADDRWEIKTDTLSGK